MIIELVGTPGVGKSYLCRAIEVHITRELNPLALTTPVFDRPFKRLLPNTLRKLVRACLFCVRNPATTWRLQHVIFKGWRGYRFGRCKKFVNLLSEFQRSNAADTSNSLMTEQGVLQAIWSLEMMAEISIYQQVMELCMNWLPDAVILVEADLTQNRRQLKQRKRGKSAFDRLSGEELVNAIERGNQTRDKILSMWMELMPDAHRLDYTNTPEGDTRYVFDWLVARLR